MPLRSGRRTSLDLELFVGYLRSRLRPPQPIEFEVCGRRFTPIWHEYVTFVSSHLESVDPELARWHSDLLYRLPSLALVPGEGGYTVYVGNPGFDTVYLGYNSAYVFTSMRRHYYVVPYPHWGAVDTLVEGGVNPATLCELLYTLPVLASIPCTRLLGEVEFVRDLLAVRALSYLASSDTALCLLGYLILELVSHRGTLDYHNVYSRLWSRVLRVLGERGVEVLERRLQLRFHGFPVTVHTVELVKRNT